VKDPEEDFKEQIADLDIPCIAEVIGFDRLRRDFREFKDRKKLLRDFDVFLADIRIYKMLPTCLGKEFYAKKMFPSPIKVHGFDSKGLQK
jgi:ribosome biogenesis protein UTP30